MRNNVETASESVTIAGETKRRVNSRSEQFELTFLNLTELQASNILSEFEINESRLFTVDETYLSIIATKVHIDITNREYVKSGDTYKQNITMVLTEVI